MRSVMDAVKTIGTHNGMFHCDEVLGCFMLKQLFPNAEIVRTRDQAVLNGLDIVIDVGGEYDPKRHRYDHHQRSFNETASSVLPGKPWTIKLSSAGLVFCHFGKEIIKKIVPDLQDESVIDKIFDKVYESLIQEVDGIDNGVPMYDGEPKYNISTHLSARVRHLNPSWNQKDADQTSSFYKAFNLVGAEFVDRIQFFVNTWLPARKIVEDAIENRFEVDPSGEIMHITQPCPWKEHYFDIEKELSLEPQVKFATYQDDSWRVIGVPVEPNSFVLRIPLHKNWFGLRDEELVKECKIDGAIFVHATGFIGGAKTKEGALQMAQQTLKLV